MKATFDAECHHSRIEGVPMADQPVRRRRVRRFALWLAAPLLALAAVPVFATAAQAVTRCTATYRVVAFWPPPGGSPGFQAAVTVINNGTTKTSGWRIDMSMPTGVFVPIRTAWNATLVPGRVSDFENMSFNGVLNPGASTEFGFIAQRVYSSTPMTPLSFYCIAYA
jgi:hypothetical protein